MLPTPGEKTREEVFIAGTEPRTFSDLPKKEQEIRRDIVENLRSSLFQMSFDAPAGGPSPSRTSSSRGPPRAPVRQQEPSSR